VKGFEVLTIMPDGPRPTNGPRYDDDFYAWTQYQAEVLRSMPASDNRFDREHVAEEIEDLGKSERDAVRSQVRRIVEHFLKLAHSPAIEPRSDWMVSIASARAELEDKLTATLRQDVQAELPRLYSRAKKIANLALVNYGETNAAVGFPGTCPYTLDQILADDWYPAPPGDPA
jgi:Domain of unknown function DUF29